MLFTSTAAVLFVTIIKTSCTQALSTGRDSNQNQKSTDSLIFRRSDKQTPVADDSLSKPSPSLLELLNNKPSSDQKDGQYQGSILSEILKHNGSINIQTGNTYMTDRNFTDVFGTIPQATVNVEPQVYTQGLIALENSQKKNHEDLMNEIAFLKNELKKIKDYLSTILRSQNTMTLALQRYNKIHS